MGLKIQMGVKRNILIIRLNGDLDQYGCRKLKVRVVDTIRKYDIQNIILNFENLYFMDSTGIGFIIGRYQDIKRKNGKIVICNVNEIVNKIFRISGLNKICKVVSTEEDAYKELVAAC